MCNSITVSMTPCIMPIGRASILSQLSAKKIESFDAVTRCIWYIIKKTVYFLGLWEEKKPILQKQCIKLKWHINLINEHKFQKRLSKAVFTPNFLATLGLILVSLSKFSKKYFLSFFFMVCCFCFLFFVKEISKGKCLLQ